MNSNEEGYKETALDKEVFHHIAIQTADFDGSVSWYQEFLGCELTWSLTSFSELTVSRLPGIKKLAELALGDTRFHVFSRGENLDQPPPPDTQQFQHLCMKVPSIEALRNRRDDWQTIYDSGRYSFTVPDDATDIVTDDDGVQSFYCRDINGLEFEFTYIPVNNR